MAKKLGTKKQRTIPSDIDRILRRYPEQAYALLRQSLSASSRGGVVSEGGSSVYAKRKLRVIDLFAGAGGFTLGLCNTGKFEPVFANDFNAYAAKTYNANFGDHCLHGDINDLLANSSFKFPEADIVIGGPMINRLHHAHDNILLFVCNSGRRSLYAARLLRSMGYPKALSVAGGFQAWKQQQQQQQSNDAQAG